MVKVWIDSKVNYEEIFSAESLHQAPVVQKVDKAIHWINLYPLDSTIIGFPNTYPLVSDLSGG